MEQQADSPRSKLDAYAEVIWELRRRRKRLEAITTFLNGHGVAVSRSTVGRWIQLHPAPIRVTLRPVSVPTASGASPSQLSTSTETHVRDCNYNDDEAKPQAPVPPPSTRHKLPF